MKNSADMSWGSSRHRTEPYGDWFRQRWWMDVLANGRSSEYAKYFDIDWHPSNANLQAKVLLPVSGKPYGEALEIG